MRFVPAWIRANTALPWAALFLALALMVTQYGGTNAASRVAALRAITEQHTLNIDKYYQWTLDWALSPNGHYYSNKAPGSVFLGLPMFALTDAFVLPLTPIDDEGRAPMAGYVQHILLMLWLQLIPFTVLVMYACDKLKAYGVPAPAVHFFALASLFGNTAAIYMGSNFGHGLSGWLFLGATLFWAERRYSLVGVFLSWALLSDYAVTFAIPFFLLATLWRERRIRPLVDIGGGSLPAAALWVWYHTTCFGSPFRTATLYSNPTALEAPPGDNVMWGTYTLIPSLRIVKELLFGTSRGLLFTQPWTLAIFALPFLKRDIAMRGLACLATGSLAGLLWMNGGFGGWHGGWAIGPRYLSVAFPALAFSLALAWTRIPRWLLPALWGALAVALVFRIFIYPFPNVAPNESIWPYHFALMKGAHRGTTILRLCLAIIATTLALYWQKKREQFPFTRSALNAMQ